MPVRLFEFVLGSLLPLTNVDNWEEHGSVTPEEAAEYFDEWLYALLDQECIVPMPIVRFFASRSSAQSISNATETTFDISTTVGPTAFFTFSPTNETIELLEDGFYSLYFQAGFAGNATGDRYAAIKDVNTGEYYAIDGGRAAAANNWLGTCSAYRFLPAGTIVYGRVWQNSGGSLNLAASTAIRAWISIVYHGET